MMNASEDLEAMMTAKSEDLSPQRQPPLLQQQQQTPRLGLLDAASHLSSSVLEADSVSFGGKLGKEEVGCCCADLCLGIESCAR